MSTSPGSRQGSRPDRTRFARRGSRPRSGGGPAGDLKPSIGLVVDHDRRDGEERRHVPGEIDAAEDELADGTGSLTQRRMIMPTVAVSSARARGRESAGWPGRWRCRRSGHRRSCARGRRRPSSGEEDADDRGGERNRARTGSATGRRACSSPAAAEPALSSGSARTPGITKMASRVRRGS